MYKWYRLQDYKPYWNNISTALPYSHIEDIVSKNNFSWQEIKKAAIQWSFPIEQAILDSKSADIPHYLKCTDGKNNFYFYLENITQVASEKDGEFIYTCTYTMDKYMTIYFNKLHILLNNHIQVNHLKRFSNRLEVQKDSTGKIQCVSLDIQKQKEFGNTLPVNNNQMVRKYLYGTNIQTIWSDNYSDIDKPTEVTFKNFIDENKTINLPWSYFETPNINKRFTYIVAKSSCLQSGASTATKDFTGHSDETKVILPVFEPIKKEIYQALNNFDITTSQTDLVNALSDANFIGIFECDIPYSLFYGLSIQGNCQLMYGTNKLSGNTINVAFFKIPLNYAPKWTILNYSKYGNGLDGKLRYLIKNIDKWNENTEPTLLNPAYYQERCYIDNGKFLSNDLSLIKYKYCLDETTGINLQAYMMFDSNLSISYDFNEYNNTLNPIWNNKYSNIRTDISLNTGVYGSASSSYYANNANSMVTSLDTLKMEQTDDWIKQGFSYTNKITGIASQAASGNLIGAAVSGIKALFGMSEEITGNARKHIEQNKQIAAQIHNIESSANTILSNPFVDSCIPNVEVEGNTLFNTYSNELHPWDKTLVFKNLLATGYPFNKVDVINKFLNRSIMNVLQVDTSYNMDLLINTLKIYDRSLFNGLTFNYLFLEWLSTLHRFYNTLDLINVLEPELESYVNNIELDLPIITVKQNINQFITNTNLKYATPATINKLIQDLNPQAPSDIWDDLNITLYENSCTISTKDSSEKYFGLIVFTTIRLPNELIIDAALDNKVLLSRSESACTSKPKQFQCELIVNTNELTVTNVNYDFNEFTKIYSKVQATFITNVEYADIHFPVVTIDQFLNNELVWNYTSKYNNYFHCWQEFHALLDWFSLGVYGDTLMVNNGLSIIANNNSLLIKPLVSYDNKHLDKKSVGIKYSKTKKYGDTKIIGMLIKFS